MKTFGQVSEILDFSRGFHQRCAEIYNRLSSESESYPIRLLLDQMQSHEQALTRCLERYSHQAPEEIMDTWIQYAPEESAEEIISSLDSSEEISLETVLDLGRKFDAALLKTYSHLAENAESEEIRALFSSLRDMVMQGEKMRIENEQTLRNGMVYRSSV